MAGKTIHAAGGIVVRNGERPKIAVVQRAKDELRVLPRGKLKRNESAVVDARREVVKETGHRVRVQESLGAITYRARGRPKVVQFWRMRAEERNASSKVMKDIVAVDWLPLSATIRRLSYPLEKLFLRNVGRAALRRQKARARRKARLPSKPKSLSDGAKSRAHKQRLRRAAGARGRNLSSRTMSRARANILQRVLGRLS